MRKVIIFLVVNLMSITSFANIFINNLKQDRDNMSCQAKQNYTYKISKGSELTLYYEDMQMLVGQTIYYVPIKFEINAKHNGVITIIDNSKVGFIYLSDNSLCKEIDGRQYIIGSIALKHNAIVNIIK